MAQYEIFSASVLRGKLIFYDISPFFIKMTFDIMILLLKYIKYNYSYFTEF